MTTTMTNNIKRGDIFYINIPFDNNDIHKQVGCRPCIIMSNDLNNKHNSRVQYIPLTTKMGKSKLPTHVLMTDTKLERESIALCECIDSISKDFILEKIGTVSEKDMFNIEIGMATQLLQNSRIKFIIKDLKQYSYA